MKFFFSKEKTFVRKNGESFWNIVEYSIFNMKSSGNNKLILRLQNVELLYS